VTQREKRIREVFEQWIPRLLENRADPVFLAAAGGLELTELTLLLVEDTNLDFVATCAAHAALTFEDMRKKRQDS